MPLMLFMALQFSKIFPWAILPIKEKVNASLFDEEDQIMHDNLRWFRKMRVREHCRSWKMSSELGYVVKSPISCSISPFIDFELESSIDPDELKVFASVSGVNQFWNRPGLSIGIEGGEWLKLYQFKHDQKWNTFFVPNGEGTVEWHLGFKIELPAHHFILVLPYDYNSAYSIPYGILDSKTLSRLNSDLGMSIALKPLQKTQIARGTPLARIIPITQESFLL
jgi:hypothetical protein